MACIRSGIRQNSGLAPGCWRSQLQETPSVRDASYCSGQDRDQPYSTSSQGWGADGAKMIGTVYGVDFSGAKLAGKTTWVAKMVPVGPRRRALRLVELSRMSKLCG